ncbi:putative ABC transporter binding protein NosD [Paenibacillus solanacearum]|uniref:ABC transporter binding protein NosD n=1 Tax=Paenibacillus solanacearum TaxID=2048548 RepID=A0A916K4C9_9BACL|nr:nitrous oxide reductase family maturation protein NosD [Paenibacillus solanacearum]CAG7641540.1 putative ABC transporter binding protein NosD [Paenibacillus solanacearum]
MRRAALCQAAAMLLLLFTASPVSGGNAAPHSEYNLQELIDATPEYGTLQLKGAVYTGNATIGKPMTITGEDGTVIQGDGSGNVVTILSSHVRLEHIAIRHSGMSMSSGEEYAAVKVSGGAHHVLNRLRIEDAYHGIYIKNADDNEISQVTVQGRGQQEIASQGNGIQLIHSAGNTLKDNVISGMRDGIYFYYADRNRVERNAISETRYGLHYMNSNDNTFTGNRFSRNTGGAAIMLSKRIELTENDFSFHQGTQAFGILMQETEQVQMSGNRFYQNQRALYIDNASRSRIAENLFLHNKVGVEIWSSASQQVFTRNKFLRNVAPVIVVGGQGSNRWSDQGQGNVWDGEPLLDLNGDGIGDDPVVYKSSLYKLIQSSELSYLFLSSPAIGLYEKIHTLLNQDDVMMNDPNPVMEARGTLPLPPMAWLLPAAIALGWLGWRVYGRRRRR